MPLYQIAPTRQLPHTIDLIQRQSAPRFANEAERDQQYPDPEIGALAVVNTTVEVFNGTGWIPVGGGQPTLINNLQDVDARFPPDGALLTWSSAAQAWGWSMPATACVSFSDDFERADGPLGAGWAAGRLRTGLGDEPIETLTPTIVDGHAEGDEDVDVDAILVNDVISTIATPGDQFVEIDVANYHQDYVLDTPTNQIVEGQFYLYCQANDTDNSLIGVMCEFFINFPDEALLSAFVVVQDAAGDIVSDSPDDGLDGVGWPDNSPKTLRLEVSEAGHVRFTCDGVVVVEGDVAPVVGDRVGFGFRWHNTSYDSGDPLTGTGTSFHVNATRGGCLE